MGHFIEATAFRCNDPHKIENSIIACLAREDIEASVQSSSEELDARRCADLYADEGDWVVVYWPRWFPYDDFAIGQALSQELGISVSHISVPFGDG